MFRDYVTDGGRLVILGGSSTLGQGGLRGTCLDEILPFELKGSCEVICSRPPRKLGSNPGIPFDDKPTVFWHHAAALRSGAIPLAFAGEQPIAVRRLTGKGQVVVFTGTVLGEGGRGARPFGECATWSALAKRMITGAE